jgi:N-acetylglucosaminyl-diphospho-decaprenol L-rhamnosyltransferase
MSKKVIAAIPTYNPGESLLRLAEQIDKQNFDAVYVLDDCSNDGSIGKLKSMFPHFNVIQGSENKGPAGNRNRILNVIHDHDAIVVFIDADMVLGEPGDIKEAVKDAFKEESVGMVGGYILDKQLKPMAWNYGHEMHPIKDAWFWQVVTTLARGDISDEFRGELLTKLRNNDVDYHWIYPMTLPLRRRRIDWVAEGLFAIKASLFNEIGGYDEKMRYHEGQDLARRIRDKGLDVIFSPSFKAVHQELHTSGEQRSTDSYKSQYYFFHKHWGMPYEVYEKLYGSHPQVKPD